MYIKHCKEQSKLIQNKNVYIHVYTITYGSLVVRKSDISISSTFRNVPKMTHL